MPSPAPSPSAERGQAVPLLVLVLVLAAAAAVLVARVAGASAERLHAQTAADAAALAGAAAGPGAAAQAAGANGASLEGYARTTDGVVVEVDFRRARATAAAAGVATIPPGHPRTGLAPAMLAALDRADELLGRSVTVVSGYRSRAEQEELWSRRHLSPYPVAPPGSSLHEVGLAIDVPMSEAPALRVVAPRAGLCQPLPWSDPVHFETCPLIPP